MVLAGRGQRSGASKTRNAVMTLTTRVLSSPPPDVDLLILSRDLAPLRPDVRRGLELQKGVRLSVHRIVGSPRPEDPNRWETIARARNAAKELGAASWVMYHDDDVVLGEGCVARLVEGLIRRPQFAALAADSANEMAHGWDHWDYPRHVGMAAAMFRRERLSQVTFRWEHDQCECLCCCRDLRRARLGIGYLRGAVAWHRPKATDVKSCPAPTAARGNGAEERPIADRPTGRILAAFDRRDADRFRRQFLRSLRATGNSEPVTAVVYGLHPSERSLLAAQRDTEVIALPGNGVSPALRRLHDFQRVIARWPADTPVAYWDAGDVLFQGSIAPLWELVGGHPESLLAVRESMGHPQNHVIVSWTEKIRDADSRRRAFDLLSARPFLNSGFAAGTARAMLRYLREGDRLLNSPALFGVGPWGDQVAMNLFCHSSPQAWHEVPDSWNYSLAARDAREFRRLRDGRIEAVDGTPVHVLHGNAGTLGWSALPYLL